MESSSRRHPSAAFHPGTRVDVWVRHQAALQALGQTLDAFRRADISTVAVKGIVLAHRLYDDVADRPIQDVDLRVVPRDLRRVVSVARERGWRLSNTSKQLGTTAFQIGSVLVEVETTIGPPGLCGLRVEEVISRAQMRTMPPGFTCLEPDLVDHAIVLVINAFKDKIVHCPSWSLSDLERIVDTPSFDADVLVRRVKAARIETVTWIVADWMARNRTSASWRAIRDRLGARARRPLYAVAYTRLADSAPGGLPMRLLARAGSDAPLRQAQALFDAILGSLIASARGVELAAP